MIALNELLKNIENYKKAYKLMGLKFNLDFFVIHEKILRETQLEFESARALCNKKCGELINNNFEDNSQLLNEIISLDKKALFFQNKMESVKSKIESRLKKLHNIPDNINLTNLQIDTEKKESDINSLKSFLKSICNLTTFNGSIKNFLTCQSEKLFNEGDLPFAIIAKDGITILCSQNEIDKFLNQLLDYFKTNSLSIIEHSIQKLKKSSTKEFFIHLKHKVYLKVELKREFYSREYKIKYHDNSIDMTKFINQINIVF